MRILIDMDDVIADAEGRFNEWYERDFGIRYTKEDIKGTKLHLVVPEEHRKTVKAYPHHKDFFKDLDVIENSREMVEQLNNRFDVYIASAAMEFPYSLPHKYEWLDKNFPFIHWKRRIFCGDKSVLKGDILIDDHDFNLSVFEGRSIMFTAAHNATENKYERLNNWLEAEKLFDLK
ncbi:MAG: 5'(3')-deoxyribonucleotidase [Bacteroidota bacterium]|nr:5'(3')-deoxyribonucleotidase [Bacteroidota bacterium]